MLVAGNTPIWLPSFAAVVEEFSLRLTGKDVESALGTVSLEAAYRPVPLTRPSMRVGSSPPQVHSRHQDKIVPHRLAYATPMLSDGSHRTLHRPLDVAGRWVAVLSLLDC